MSFSFKKIPHYIKEGGPQPGLDYSGAIKVDTELLDINIRPPEVVQTLGPWSQAMTTTRICDTLGEEGVAFTVRRWIRGDERTDYWTAEQQGEHPDHLCAVRRESWYLVVGCVTGHPFVLTPEVSWSNSDGSTQPVPLVYATADELIAAAVATGRDYVRNQAH